ncbi:unnamed protein product [Didymodactylos carnosus]|uniref:Uncharacterized protein n=1 Tax=Didymodactylos carnosus TaxID=1234261 RepID=A0A8S2YMI1_9BILA|nr:unnamed protein product [Didymodactylos carnosus]
MEIEDVLRIYQRSVSEDLRYKWLVSDDDSSAYDKVKNINIEQEVADERDDKDNNDKQKNYNNSQEDNSLKVLRVNYIKRVKKRVISRLNDIKSRNNSFQDLLQDVASISTSASAVCNQ